MRGIAVSRLAMGATSPVDEYGRRLGQGKATTSTAAAAMVSATDHSSTFPAVAHRGRSGHSVGGSG